MKRSQKLRAAKPVLVLSTASALLLTPGARSRDVPLPLGVGEACASGMCCQRTGTFCVLDGHVIENFYFVPSGVCS